MADNTPQPIKTAQVVIEELKTGVPVADVAVLSRLLPRLAMAFHQSGQDATSEVLRHHAQQGVRHLRVVLKEAAAQLQRTPDYDSIVSRLKLPIFERVEEQHLFSGRTSYKSAGAL